MKVTGDQLVVKDLIRTRRYSVDGIARLVAETGFVNLYRRAYPRLVFKDERTRRLTALNRRTSEMSVVVGWVNDLNAAIGAASSRKPDQA